MTSTAPSSLVGSIFGNVESSSGLLNVFEASSTLPERPQHKPLPRKKTKQRKKTAETIVTEPEKKKRKRNGETADAEEDGQGAVKDDAAVDVDQPSTTNYTEITTTSTTLDDDPLVESTRLRSIATTGVKVAPDQKGNQALVKKVSVNTKHLDTDARTTAQGYVVFVDKASVEKAMDLNNSMVGSHLIRVDRVNPTIDATRSVFVGNLPYQADEVSLRQHFVQGCALSNQDIENVRIVRDKVTQQCKGFGYVLFATKTMATTALQRMHESTYKKRSLRVTVCGKRFKGRKGDPSEKEKKAKPVDAAGALKRILTKDIVGGSNKRKRGDTLASAGPKKTVANPNGLSRRQASEAKLEKRHKKLQKRAAKGMGKTKKGF
ncbi:hypothetical protein MHU86_23336 [Fragilaria crotonensis]|nr:hypothetical protein MHU86_23336 [Fragilaria crotonensis]